ncbi:MAG: 3-methyl-2-oxobutanoate hydroxymethyltransferase [Candidatus Eisenbacteria sp.]|nr:3-methyl-2-oxobutanoate hydroxymethyltransferase [Candidatus Eisenbacteria bacterium]
MNRKKITVPCIRKMKSSGEKITVLTAYDYPTARLLDRAGVEILLVGDSVGNVVLGYENTLPVTVAEMVHHTAAVARAKPTALVVADMPFMSYQASPEEAVRNAGRFVKEARAEAVKLEGGKRILRMVETIIRADIPVMGHIGLTPQSVHRMGGYRVQGRGPKSEKRLIEDARALEETGCFSIVLEGITSEVAEKITAAVGIPTIGIGAGPGCDGQVLVVHDLLGMDDEFRPRFVKRYDELGKRIRDAVECYVAEVKSGRFPGPEHCYTRDREAEKRRSGETDPDKSIGVEEERGC